MSNMAKRFEEDGKAWYEFESKEARIRVATAFRLDDAKEEMLHSLIHEIARITAETEEVWREIHEALGTDPLKHKLTYNHLTGRVYVEDLPPEMQEVLALRHALSSK